MRVIHGRIHPIRIHVALVFDLQINQGRLQQFTVTEFDRETIGFEFILATEQVHQEGKENFRRRREPAKQHQSNNYRHFIVEPECFVNSGAINEMTESIKETENVDLSHKKHLELMPALPVTKFVTQNGTDFVFAILLDESIEKDDALGEESEKVSIRVGTALAAVHDEYLRKRELELVSQGFNLGAKRTLGKAFKFVEKGLDEGWENEHHEHLETKDKQPEVQVKLIPESTDNPNEGSNEGTTKDGLKKESLENVREEESEGLLVEAVLPFNNKS